MHAVEEERAERLGFTLLREDHGESARIGPRLIQPRVERRRPDIDALDNFLEGS